MVTYKDIVQLPSPPAGIRIAYGDNVLAYGDLRLPENQAQENRLHPLAVVIHGGCWQSENDLAHAAHASAALTAVGIATWTIEYRRIGNAGGGWTGTFDDVAAGANFVRVLAQRFPLDLNRVVFVGHSAGGHLALWLAARRNLPLQGPLCRRESFEPRGVVSLAGITDLRAFGAVSGYCNDSVAELLGGKPDQVPERYALTSPIELLPSLSMQHIVHGSLDTVVPLGQSQSYVERALAVGSNVHLSVLDGVGHFDLIAPFSPAWLHIKEIILKLLGEAADRN